MINANLFIGIGRHRSWDAKAGQLDSKVDWGDVQRLSDEDLQKTLALVREIYSRLVDHAQFRGMKEAPKAPEEIE